jgi:hypothetical protein
MSREITSKIIEHVDEGILDPKTALMMALVWMSESDVKEMAKANELFSFEEEEE